MRIRDAWVWGIGWALYRDGLLAGVVELGRASRGEPS